MSASEMRTGADAPLSGRAVPEQAIDVTIVMPCLNERNSLPHCILNARAALAEIDARYGLKGEILIADNGSTDGSQMLSTGLGARVVDVPERGYGAALIGGAKAARGRYIIMGDSDGSYDFTDGVAMVDQLIKGADLCMGSRFQGGIEPGAMPWKNRYIGNPVLTGILNLFFRAGVDDAHCGLRALTKEAFQSLALSGKGMEFASEMVVKASLKKLKIVQTPATLSRDLRDRPPHLRPWRDGWRHLRYLLFLSPTWSFGMPALFAMGAGAAILGYAFLHLIGVLPGESRFGASWTIAAGFLFANGHLALLMAVAAHLHGVKSGERALRPIIRRLGRLLTLETMLAIGGGFIALAIAGYAVIMNYWAASGYVALPNTLPLVLSALCGAVGIQTVFGGFLIGVVLGHKAEFVDAPAMAAEPAATSSAAPAPSLRKSA
jgi:glycosyltransferase involved in cell wall biosynthesis